GRFRGQQSKADVFFVQHFFYPTSSLCSFLASGVHHQQHSTFKRHFGPASIASRTAHSSSSADKPRSVSARNHRKYSTLPEGPGSGLGVTPTVCQHSSPARRATVSTAPARSSELCTTPPAPTCPLPTSNCGFTMGTIVASGAA